MSIRELFRRQPRPHEVAKALRRKGVDLSHASGFAQIPQPEKGKSSVRFWAPNGSGTTDVKWPLKSLPQIVSSVARKVTERR